MTIMKKLVVFDLDGTLLDTIADLAAAVNHAMEQGGYPTHTIDEVRGFVGNGVRKLIERALPVGERSMETQACMLEKFREYYNVHNADLSRPYPGVPAMLRRLQCRGLLLAVASNKYQAATEKLVACYFPDIHFAQVCGQRDGIPVKPHPMVVLGIMEAAHVDCADVLYVGDSDVDMQTAANAGVDAVAVSWGFRPRAELEAYRPLAVIDRAGELDAYC